MEETRLKMNSLKVLQVYVLDREFIHQPSSSQLFKYKQKRSSFLSFESVVVRELLVVFCYLFESSMIGRSCSCKGQFSSVVVLFILHVHDHSIESYCLPNALGY